jgi:hypothetical protein
MMHNAPSCNRYVNVPSPKACRFHMTSELKFDCVRVGKDLALNKITDWML